MKAKNLYLAAITLSLQAIITCLPAALSAQPEKEYPKNYFRWPLNLNPAIVANFGELRPNHWHMGLDIRTNQKENQPVYAAASGYIARIRIERSGFGQCIWINHPNGLTTLYAHLNSFFPALGKYITEQQYRREAWAIELEFPKEKFPVTKGQLIAYSGNTGGSQGPHLHFEIRDTKTDECLNPLLFGMPLQDNVPPTLSKLAIYDRSGSIYEEVTVFSPLKNTDTGYTILKTPVIKTGLNKLSFALQAFDRMSVSKNENGIYSAQLFFDKKPIILFAFDSISYRETKYLNAHVDYKYRFNGGVFFQHLSQLPGNRSRVYYPDGADGIILLNDTAVHSIRIEVRDAYQNLSVLKFSIQHSDEIARPAKVQSTAKQFVPNYVNVLEKPGFEAYLPETCLYDTLRSYYNRGNDIPGDAVSATHQVNDPSIPVHAELTIRIKPDKPIPDEARDRIILQRSYRNEKTVRKAVWEGDWLSAKFGDFGIYQAFIDMEPPTINDPGGHREGKEDTFDLSAAKRIVFQPGDNFGGIQSFRAELDGKWLRFTNDKGWAYIYIFDEHCPFGTHELKVSIEDIAGNETIKTWWFKRYPYHPGKKVSKKKSGSKKVTPSRKPAPATIPTKKKSKMITLKEGDKAPSFTGRDQNGKKISLADYKGKMLVLYFYSEAGSPTCTIESCNLRDNYSALKKRGFEIVGVSPDDEKAQKKFELKYKLPFPLIADADRKITSAYGVWDMKKLFGREYMGILRTTFIIDGKGVICKIFFKPKNKAHAEEIMKALTV